ncbi:MAG: winged helix-turn-helix domain-containing protein [Chloroflexota bacterium]|nr:winged helix-turn-helix domain-containing protein [Chloroflexota bacterium]
MEPVADASPPTIRARLLGPVQITVGDRPVPDEAWPRRSARALLRLLLATPGHQLARDQVLDLLWPDATPKTALTALYVALHALRRVLEPDLRSGRASAYVEVAGDVIRLRPEAVGWVDVDAFDIELRGAVGPDRRERLAAALALYAGDLLADEPYADWLVPRREWLRRAWRGAVLDLAELELADHPLAVLPDLERLVAADPADEAAHQGLMRALAAAGRRDQALRQYERCVKAVREELDAEPTAKTMALATAIRASAPVSPTPAAPVAVTCRLDILPASPNPLVGRERELEVLEDLP